MSWHVLKLDLNSARWMPKLVSIDAQSYPALTSQSLRATTGPLQDKWPLCHYVIGISGILPYNRNVTLQTLELFSAYTRLYNAAASPASRLRLAGSLAIICIKQWGSRGIPFPVSRWGHNWRCTCIIMPNGKHSNPSGNIGGWIPSGGWIAHQGRYQTVRLDLACLHFNDIFSSSGLIGSHLDGCTIAKS